MLLKREGDYFSAFFVSVRFKTGNSIQKEIHELRTHMGQCGMLSRERSGQGHSQPCHYNTYHRHKFDK